MGETAQQPAALSTRQPIPGVASLRVNPERIERMWQMTAQQRVEAAQQGQFTLGEMLRWASRRPSEAAVGRRRVVLHRAACRHRGRARQPAPRAGLARHVADAGGRPRHVEQQEPVMRVLIADQDQQLAAERARQLVIDGHEPVIALSARRCVQARRAARRSAARRSRRHVGRRSGSCASCAPVRATGRDNTVPVLVIGADSDTDRSATTAPAPTPCCQATARHC